MNQLPNVFVESCPQEVWVSWHMGISTHQQGSFPLFHGNGSQAQRCRYWPLEVVRALWRAGGLWRWGAGCVCYSQDESSSDNDKSLFKFFIFFSNISLLQKPCMEFCCLVIFSTCIIYILHIIRPVPIIQGPHSFLLDCFILAHLD